ncbi:Zinc finger protein 586 [Hondaea fermentalgiana]|uniref:Zinc finger protein 586 n=1 Tax=Hondaea fermentalgiana TaxID=2315210 RepID=A0A2R5GT13_9STRA|nr:Zinc finger protein 586 [Hondaea fermentalgiana]|eukprot:GBG33980.1 Zinc finger protein 586 [Hondaea fermentalgiana]
MMQQHQQQQLLQEQEQAAAASAQNSAKPFSCTKCTRSFATNSGLESHILNVHINKKVYECPQCSKKFSANGSLKRHVETVHNRKRDFQCLRCGKLFALKHHLKNHMITVHHEKNVDLSNVKPITRRQTPSPQHHQLSSHASPPAPSSSPSAPLTSASLAPSARQERRESSYSVSSFSGFSAPFLGMLASNSSANGSSHMPSLLDMGGMLGANATHAAMQSLAGANNSHNDDHSASAMPTSMYDPNTTAEFRNLLGNLNYGLPSQEEDHVQSTLSSLTNPGSNSFVPEDSFASLMNSYNNSYNNRDQAQQRRTSFFETAPVHPFNTFGNGFNSDKSYPGIPSIPSMPSTSSNSGN